MQSPARRIVTEANGDGRYLRRWKPDTTYTTGESVLSPAGDVVTAKADHTSGAGYTAANWNLSASYVTAQTGPDGSISLYQNGVEL